MKRCNMREKARRKRSLIKVRMIRNLQTEFRGILGGGLDDVSKTPGDMVEMGLGIP